MVTRGARETVRQKPPNPLALHVQPRAEPLASGTATPSSPLASTVFSQHVTTAIGAFQTFTPASGTYGRYVKVQYDGAPQFNDTYLQLAEVDVEGQVHVTGTPEPTSLVLFATGLLAIGARARRRRAT